MTREMGKVLAETRGDVQEAIDTAYYMAGEGRRLFGQTTPSELKSKFAMSVRMPVGVCGMIAPWNFPMAIPSWKLFPALVCGNTCVIKPAEDTPLSTYNLVQCLIDAGLPAGVVNIVTGFGPDAGAPIVSHPGVRAVSFTGSSEVGRIVGQTAAANFKPCSLEMGGKNAMIVLDDANLDLAVEGALWGAFGTTGQRCTATSRIILHKKIAAEFTEKLVARADALKVGDGLDESVQMGPQVNQQQIETSTRYCEIALKEGAKLLTGGSASRRRAPTTRDTSSRPPSSPGSSPACASPRKRSSARSSASSSAPTSTKPSTSPTASTTASRPRSTPATSTSPSAPCATSKPESPTSTPPPSEPKSISPSAESSTPATATAKAGPELSDFYTTWKSVYFDYSDKLQRAQIDTGE